MKSYCEGPLFTQHWNHFTPIPCSNSKIRPSFFTTRFISERAYFPQWCEGIISKFRVHSINTLDGSRYEQRPNTSITVSKLSSGKDSWWTSPWWNSTWSKLSTMLFRRAGNSSRSFKTSWVTFLFSSKSLEFSPSEQASSRVRPRARLHTKNRGISCAEEIYRDKA